MKTRKIVDRVVVHVRAGKGGDGSASFRREACVPRGGPDGGDGGRGGHVLFRGSRDVDSLIGLSFAPQLFAENGVAGRGQKMYGRRGRDRVVRVPCGTSVFDAETGELIADVVGHDEEVVIARGGKGGLGNVHFKTATHQVPTEHTPGEPGEEFRLRLELKTIADAGLLGFPNAGKSSLLACLSGARPKIANYPFTTLNPIVGTLMYPDFSQLRVADVPGIIEGAAAGVGLGTSFLKHIARSRVLIFVVDMAGTDNRLPWKDYLALRNEIAQHNAEMLDRPSLVLANKMDVAAAAEYLPRFVRETGVTPIRVSAVTPDDPGVAEVKQSLWDLLRPAPRGVWTAVGTAEPETGTPSDGDGEAGIPEVSLRRAPFLDLSKKTPKKKRH
ncbi:MAG TPA: GTPase ObgE [Kiritimatiellia bacterium]|nr:GTPase ObgE [Kiritimatiellia bacterium]HOM59722.1 GTPase ObgE [Kiritimatiellia bacterium]HOR97671.1 GTPase ObgE [Kiritimatiellia bacterium]HPK37595.1 GTPase ObgE [Kiritimatiellia bacterium]HPW74828.1 GTPase ObgE [Kiritimatiellia bacterium]